MKIDDVDDEDDDDDDDDEDDQNQTIRIRMDGGPDRSTPVKGQSEQSVAERGQGEREGRGIAEGGGSPREESRWPLSQSLPGDTVTKMSAPYWPSIAMVMETRGALERPLADCGRNAEIYT